MAENFPKDRFDETPADLDRVGAHRAPARRGSALVWLAWCLLATLIIVAAGWIWIKVLDKNTSAGLGDDTTVSAPPSSSDAQSSPSTPAVVPTLVPKAQITVLNATTSSGLAAKGVAKLKSDGFTNATAANAATTDITTTVVYYSDDASAGVAAEAAKALGGAVKTQKSDAYADSGDVATVVLGSDFTG